MSIRRLTRRQAMGVMAAASAAVWPCTSRATATRAGFVDTASVDTETPGPGAWVYRWRGSALGVRASVALFGEDAFRGAELRPGWVAELDRLDATFSLYRNGSALRRLNRAGSIDAPPLELVELLSMCRGLHRLTGGVFDPTVQPLWELYARRFSTGSELTAGDGRGNRGNSSSPPAVSMKTGPGYEERDRALRLVGFEGVAIEPARIEYGKAGMGVTLNGIAQGYLTDRIAQWLLRAGVTNALVDVGEIRAFGRPSNGERWRIGRAGTRDATSDPVPIEFTEGAVATSSPAGFLFGANPRYHHLFDSRTGDCATGATTVTVVAPNATLADGLSTAFAMMAPSRVREVAAAVPGVTVHAEPVAGG